MLDTEFDTEFMAEFAAFLIVFVPDTSEFVTFVNTFDPEAISNVLCQIS